MKLFAAVTFLSVSAAQDTGWSFRPMGDPVSLKSAGENPIDVFLGSKRLPQTDRRSSLR